MKILVIEDDVEMAAYILDALVRNDCLVDIAADGKQGLSLASCGSYDVAVVDRMLPSLDGLTLVICLRGSGVRTPVLFLTTMGGIDDRVEGLNAGGDDYLVKPFAFSELLARINALARRSTLTAADTILRAADLEIDLLKRSAIRDGHTIDLQPREFKLLECLMRNAGRVVTRTMLLEEVWGFNFDPQTNIVETHVSRLRTKVDRGFGAELIQTVRGSGYLLRAPE
jgi:two-component system, OmpR family, response regulator